MEDVKILKLEREVNVCLAGSYKAWRNGVVCPGGGGY
jgi:hypothetical protein